MNKIEVDCHLFLNRNDDFELRRFTLELNNYNELVKQIRVAFKDLIAFERLITYRENDKHELVSFNTDQGLESALRSEQYINTRVLKVFVEMLPTETTLPDSFYI